MSELEALKAKVKELTKEVDRLKGLTTSVTKADTFDTASGIDGLNKFHERIKDGKELFKELADDMHNSIKQLAFAGDTYFLNFEEGGKFQSSLRNAMDYAQKMTGNFKLGSEVVKKLSGNMKSFVSFSENGLKSLTRQSVIFQKLGLDASSYGKILDSARLAYGLTEDASIQLGNRLMTLSTKLSIPPQQLAADFNQAQKTMAYDSEKLNNIFHKLQYTSRTTGISFGELTSKFGDTMDNFKGSADVAGRLNAVLGDSVFNSIELLGMNEAERVATITDRVRNSLTARGTDINKLGKFELKAIAKSIGLSTEDTRRLLSGESVDVERALESMAGGDLSDPAAAAGKELDFFTNTLRRTRTEIENYRVAMNARAMTLRQEGRVMTAGHADRGLSFFAADYLKGERKMNHALAKRLDVIFQKYSMDEFQKRQVSDIAIVNASIVKTLEGVSDKSTSNLRRIINSYRTATTTRRRGIFDDRKTGVRFDMQRQIELTYPHFTAIAAQMAGAVSVIASAAKLQRARLNHIRANTTALQNLVTAFGRGSNVIEVVNINAGTPASGRPATKVLSNADKAKIVQDVLEILNRR